MKAALCLSIQIDRNHTVHFERVLGPSCSAFVCGFVWAFAPSSNITLPSHAQPQNFFSSNTHSITSTKMALPGIEGFPNVHEILEAVSARSVDDKFRLRRAARKIRLALMCADSKTLNEEDRASLIAILGLLVIDWDQAEVCCLPQSILVICILTPWTGPSPRGSPRIPPCTRQSRHLLRHCHWSR
jgi:hypothetical protein